MRRLTPYEVVQYHRIAGWKSEAPSFLRTTWELIEHPLIVAVQKFIPEDTIRNELKLAYQMSEIFSERGEILRIAGISDVKELRNSSLKRCDKLAQMFIPRVSSGAYERSMAFGVTGGNSILTNVPITLMFALKAVHTIGFCYGFDADTLLERAYALGILRIASAKDLAQKQQAIASLRDAEDEVVSEAIEEFIATLIEDAIGKTAGEKSIPFVGAAFGAALDGAYANRVAEIAMRTFQERWMRVNDRVDIIPPDPEYARSQLRLLQGSASFCFYWATSSLSFFTTFPFLLVNSFIPHQNVIALGFSNGSRDATSDAQEIHDRVHEFLFSSPEDQLPAKRSTVAEIA